MKFKIAIFGLSYLASFAVLCSLISGVQVSSAATLPDLIVTSVTGFPPYSETGSLINVTDTVKNNGDLRANASITRYYLSKDNKKSSADIPLSGSRAIPKLPPGNTSSGPTQLTLPVVVPTGSYYLISCADAKKRVIEINESNNCMSSQSQMKIITRFTGAHSFVEEYDNNIEDGVTLDEKPMELAIKRQSLNRLKANAHSVSIPLVQRGNVATLPSYPYIMGTFNLLELLLLSDGNNMVYTGIGQEAYDIYDISLSVANWIKTPIAVSVDDFVGTWSGISYGDPNLMDTSQGFSSHTVSERISKVDEETISIEGELAPLLLRVNNNRATLENVPIIGNSSITHALTIMTDGSGLSGYLVATELDDPADVSVTIWLMKKK